MFQSQIYIKQAYSLIASVCISPKKVKIKLSDNIVFVNYLAFVKITVVTVLKYQSIKSTVI